MAKVKDLGIKIIPETMKPPEIGGGAAQNRVCMPTVCSDCTFQQCSILGGITQHGCSDCTIQNCSFFGGVTCGVCSFNVCTVAGTICHCSNHPITFIITINLRDTTGPTSPCGTTHVVMQQPGLTRDQVGALKDALKTQISALEEHEKSLGPKTAEEIDSREKAIKEELADLQSRRKSLKK